MARAAQAAMAVGVAVFGFDADPAVAPSRALQVLTVRRGLPRGDLEARERFAAAAIRVAAAAGVDVGVRKGVRSERLRLVDIDDDPGRGPRTVTAWYYATAPIGEVTGPGTWATVGRGLRLEARDSAAIRLATERLRRDARQIGGAAGLVGDVFTATTCSASMSPSTAAPRAATAPSGAASRNCARAGCSALCRTASSPP